MKPPPPPPTDRHKLAMEKGTTTKDLFQKNAPTYTREDEATRSGKQYWRQKKEYTTEYTSINTRLSHQRNDINQLTIQGTESRTTIVNIHFTHDTPTHKYNKLLTFLERDSVDEKLRRVSPNDLIPITVPFFYT